MTTRLPRRVNAGKPFLHEREAKNIRPKLSDPKRLLSIRVATSVIAAWKASGAGWQTRMAEVLAKRASKAKGG